MTEMERSQAAGLRGSRTHSVEVQLLRCVPGAAPQRLGGGQRRVPAQRHLSRGREPSQKETGCRLEAAACAPTWRRRAALRPGSAARVAAGMPAPNVFGRSRRKLDLWPD